MFGREEIRKWWNQTQIRQWTVGSRNQQRNRTVRTETTVFHWIYMVTLLMSKSGNPSCRWMMDTELLKKAEGKCKKKTPRSLLEYLSQAYFQTQILPKTTRQPHPLFKQHFLSPLTYSPTLTHILSIMWAPIKWFALAFLIYLSTRGRKRERSWR